MEEIKKQGIMQHYLTKIAKELLKLLVLSAIQETLTLPQK